MIMFTVLFSVVMPVNVSSIMITIMHITNLDVVNEYVGEDLFELMNFSETDPFNENFDAAGYQSSNFIIELGPLFFIVVFYVFAVICKYLLKCCS